jgi:hypothetical protein
MEGSYHPFLLDGQIYKEYIRRNKLDYRGVLAVKRINRTE